MRAVSFFLFQFIICGQVFGAEEALSFSGGSSPVTVAKKPGDRKSADVEIQEWAEVVPQTELKRLKVPSTYLSEVLFDLVDDIKIFKLNLGDADLDFRTQRRVFDNHDILNSWTVIDRFRLQGNVPIWSMDLGSGAGAGLSIGAEAGMDFINIRQVLPHDYEKLPTVEENKKSVQGSRWYKDFVADSKKRGKSEGYWAPDTKKKEKRRLFTYILPNTPENNAQFSDLWKMLIVPFRLPLSTESVAKMQDGEILSFLVYGTVGFGPSIGWDLDPINVVGDAQASFTTYLRGVFRVSVLKEDSRYVRVKYTYQGAWGKQVSAGTDAEPTFLEGFFLASKAMRQLQVIPFDFSVRWGDYRAFDIGYRYDLHNEGSAEAYEDAVRGRMDRSDELTRNPDGSPADPAQSGVQKIFVRSSYGIDNQIARKMRLGFIFRSDHETSVHTVNAQVTFPDGTKKYFRSVAENDKRWKTVWGMREKMDYVFNSSVDLDRYEADPNAKDAFIFSAEGKIEDTRTSPSELVNYILEAENAIAQPGIFPRPPRREKKGHLNMGLVTGDENAGQYKGGNLGRSSFFYRLVLDREQIERFIAVPESKMWKYLEEVFPIPEGHWTSRTSRGFNHFFSGLSTLITLPLYVSGYGIDDTTMIFHAQKIKNRWAKIKELPTIRERAEMLGRMFYDREHSYRLINLLRNVLEGEQISYVVTGSNPVFGRIWRDGSTVMRYDDIATRAEREVDFDRDGPRIPGEEDGSRVTQIHAEVVSADIVKIHFSLQEEPRAIFMDLYDDRKWDTVPYKNPKLGQALVTNNGEFKQGDNLVVLDKNNTESPWYELARHLTRDSRYRARIASNITGLNWGPATEVNFKTPD